MTRFFAVASLFALLTTAPAFAYNQPACDSFPSGIERINKAENIGQIDDVMVEFGSQNRLGEEGLQSLFNGDLDSAKKVATELLQQVQSNLCSQNSL